MKVMVFGQTGQVARELARIDPNMVFLPRSAADLTDPEACAAQIVDGRPDAVINAAAYTAVDAAETDRETAFVVNAAAPGAMAEAAAGQGVPFVHISSDYVFDGQGTRPWQPQDAAAPISVYGASKLAGEEAVRAAGGPHAILRTSWVFSQWGRNFVTTMLRLGVERSHLTIVADQIGGPTWAGDIAESCLRIAAQLRAEEAKTGTYHYSGVAELSWADFARTIFERAGVHVDVEDIPSTAFPTAAERPKNSRMDCSATRQAFGIARPDWRIGLDRVLAACQA